MHNADNCFSNYRQAVFDPDWFYYTVCSFCRSVCSPSREDRIANHKLIINSGAAALRLDGSHVVAKKNAIEMQTPFSLCVVVPREELSPGWPKTSRWPGQFPLDREVIKYVRQHVTAADAKKPRH